MIDHEDDVDATQNAVITTPMRAMINDGVKAI
jgi:hypothetical protein